MFYTPPAGGAYVAPYETLNFLLSDAAGVLTTTLKIDTTNGAVVCTFSTIAFGRYEIDITGAAGVFGLMVSSGQRTGGISPDIGIIKQNTATQLELSVHDHATGNYRQNWEHLNLTIYVKLT
jgi:hypothetical protein